MPFENIDFSLYLNIAFFSVLAIGLIFGLLKGFRRSLYTFIITIVFIAIFFITVNPVVAYLYNMELNFIGGLLSNVSSGLSQTTSVQEAARLFLFNTIGDNLDTSQTNPEFLAFVDALGIFVLKIAYTIIYFTVIQLLYRLILFIISLFIFRKGRSKNKKGKRGRALGGVFGTLTAAVNVFVMIIVLSGVISISESLVSIQAEPQSYQIDLELNKKPSIVNLDQSLNKIGKLNPQQMAEPNSELDDAIASLESIIDEYNNNIIIQSLNAYQVEDEVTGENKNMAIVLFDEILSINYQDDSIALRQDLKTFSEIASIYLNSDFYSTNDLSDLKSQEINDMFETLSESRLITTIIPIGIEVGVDYMDVDVDLTKELLYEDIVWQEELAQLGVVASTGFMILENANAFEDEVDYETISLNGQVVDNLFTELSNSKLVEYGAYIAVQPLLEGASQTIQSVITVPEDIDWKAEFRAFGAIANEILSTGITISDLQGENQQDLLLLFTDVDLTVLLNSTLTSNALVNILSGESELDFNIEFLVIPSGSDIEWMDTIDEQSGDVIHAGELRNILTSLNILVQQLDNIDIDNLQIQDLSDLTDEDIDQMFESVILVATISQLITDLDTGDFNLVIPDRVLDENQYIMKEEVSNIFKAITMAAREIPCDAGNTACSDIGFDMDKVTQLSSDNIDTLFASDILYATTGSMLSDFEEIVVPEDVKEELLVDDQPINIPSKQEIKNAFTAITALGITDFQNLSISGDLLLNLSIDPETDPTTLDTNKTDKIFASKILHATISYFILQETDVTPPETSPLVIPYYASEDYDGTTTDVVRYYDSVGEVDYISAEELTNIIAAVLVLDITDFSTFDTIEINTIIANSQVLLDSAILHATISDQILNIEGDMLIVPTMSENNIDLLIVTGDIPAEETTYIIKSELVATLDALEILEITSFENPNIDISVLNKLADDTDPTELNTSNTQALFSSKILHATISDFIIQEADGTDSANLILPYYASVNYDGTTSNVVRITNNADEVYISINELEAVIAAFLKLEIDDFTEVDSLELTTIFDNSDVLLASAILHATISDQIIELGNGDTLTVPNYDLDDNSIYITTGSIPEEETTYILIEEINNTLLALEVLEIDDFNNVNIDASIINKLSVDEVTNPTELSTSKMTTLLSSKIVHATISKVIRDAAEPDTTTGESDIVIPTYAADNYDSGSDDVIVTTIGSDIYIVEDELNNLLQAYLLLEITDFSEVDTLDLTIISDNIEDLLESAILHATITKLILDSAEEDPITGDSDLVVPYFATDNYSGTTSNVVRETIRSTDTYVSKLELFELFEALELLGIDDFTAVETLTLADINLHKTELLQSSILHATVSMQVIELGDSDDLEFPELYFTDETYSTEASLKVLTGVVLDGTDTEFIIKTELISTLEALDILEIQDFNNVNIDASILKKLSIDEVTNPTEISVSKTNTLLSSKIVHATISKVIKDAAEPDAITGESDITLPTYASDNYGYGSDEVTMTTSTLDEYIVEDELIELFGAYLLLDIEDFSEVGGLDLTLIASNRVEMLESAILHATISNIIIEESEPDAITGESTIIVPFFATDNYATTSTNLVRETINSTDTYITKLELYELFEALELLGIDDFTAVDSLTIAQINQHKTALLESSILHATVSDQVIELGDSESLVLPSLYFTDENYDTEESIQVTSGDPLDNTETTFIIKLELINTLDALDILEISNLSSVNIDASVLRKLSVDEVTNPTTLSETKTNTLLSSKIVHATISKVIKDAAEVDPITSQSDISIPTYASENYNNGSNDVSVTTLDSDEYIVEDELIELFRSYLILEITDFSEVDTLNLTVFAANIDTIVESAILHATVSKQILDAAEPDLITGESDILVPYEATDNYSGTLSNLTRQTINSTDEYITKLELFELFEALEVLGIDNFDAVEATLSLTNMINNSDELLDSAILHATMSDSIINEDTLGTIKVPYEATDVYAGTSSKLVRISVQTTLPDTSTHTDIYISKNEFNEMFEALTALGISDFTQVEGSLTLTNMIANKDALLESAILHATMSDSIIEENTTGDIVVPYEATENYLGSSSKLVRVNIDTLLADTSTHTDTYITKDEFNELFEALDALGIADFADVSTLLLSDIITNKTALLESAIMHATISKQVIDLETSNPDIIIPDKDQDGIDVILIDSNGENAKYITKTELEATFDAFDLIGGINNLSDFNGSINLNIFYESQDANYESNQDTLLASSIMQATISLKLQNLETGNKILIPSTDVLSNSIEVTYGSDYYVFRSEIKNLINALDIFGISTMESFAGTISIASFTSSANQDKLFDSAIMHMTVSNQILSNSSIIVPEESLESDLSNDVVRLLVSGNEFIEHQEVRDLIKVMNLISSGNIGEFSGDISLSLFDSETNPTNQADLLESAIMHATISKQIIDLDTASTIIVPNLDYTGTQIRYTVIGATQAISTDYLVKAEVGYLIDGLNRLGLGSSPISDFDGNLSVTELTNQAVQDDVLSSASLHATLSDKILTGSLIVPDRDITDTFDIKVTRGVTTYVEKDEVSKLIAALDEFGVTDFASGISSTAVTGLSSAQLDIVLDSGTMHLTIEDIIKDNGSAIVIPDIALDDIFALTDIITSLEIKNFILAMNTLGETDLANTTISFSTIASLTASDQSVILDSAIVRATITPDVETTVNNANSNPLVPDYTGTWEYESDGTTLTKPSIQGVIDQYY